MTSDSVIWRHQDLLSSNTLVWSKTFTKVSYNCNRNTKSKRNKEDIVSRFSNRTEVLKNQKFKSHLDTIVACIAFKRRCGMGVGKWMKLHCRHWDPKKRSRITELCKFSAAIYMNWELIKHNLQIQPWQRWMQEISASGNYTRQGI